jgi:ABC-type Fe3+-citrate transport system substrate-binding protein
MELTAGVLLEINSATKIDVELSKAKASETDLATHESKMEVVASKLAASELELTNIGTVICSGALRLFC